MEEDMVVKEKIGQWTIQRTYDEDGNLTDYNIYNEDEQGNKRYYQIIQGRYNNPILEPEPDLKVPAPPELEYEQNGQSIDPKDLWISGVMVQAQSPDRFKANTIARFSLTNGPEPNTIVSEDFTTVQVDGTTYYLTKLVIKDQNRFVPNNYDAVYGPNKPEKVKFQELAQISFIWN